MELWSVQDTAKRLAVAPITVRRLIEAGHLEAFKVGKVVRITEQSVTDYLMSRRVGGAA